MLSQIISNFKLYNFRIVILHTDSFNLYMYLRNFFIYIYIFIYINKIIEFYQGKTYIDILD